MECPKGSTCSDSDHTVKTLKMAKEWFEDITEDQIPIRVNQLTASNGRVQITIRDNTGSIVHTRG